MNHQPHSFACFEVILKDYLIANKFLTAKNERKKASPSEFICKTKSKSADNSCFNRVTAWPINMPIPTSSATQY